MVYLLKCANMFDLDISVVCASFNRHTLFMYLHSTHHIQAGKWMTN